MLKTVYEWVRWFSGRAGGKLESLRGKFSCLNETTNATKAECNSHLKLKVATAATRATTRAATRAATTTKRFVAKTETFFCQRDKQKTRGKRGGGGSERGNCETDAFFVLEVFSANLQQKMKI